MEYLGDFVGSILGPALQPLVERNIMPDFIVRRCIRLYITGDLAKAKKLSTVQAQERTRAFVDQLKSMPIAVAQAQANDQHYEVPSEFYKIVLGPFLKYSSGYWPKESTTLAESEVAMLELYCQRAELEDGMTLIDLGCGWGSVTLFMAAKYPRSKIISISNSNTQREFIMGEAGKRGHKNVTVFTGDISTFDLPVEYHETADRVISIEMFEHMKNYALLLKKISSWMKAGGKLFVHIFTHKDFPSHFEKGWMAETFFTGGTMPSDDLLLYFQNDLAIEDHWRVNGCHYQKTLEAWLVLTDENKAKILPIFEKTYGQGQALKWFVNWRMFFIACSEFFGLDNGEEYIVSHYRFVKKV